MTEDWKEENFAVYYTTNGRTIAAKMNGEFLDDTTYEFKIFQPGMYAFVNTQKEIEEPKEDTTQNEEQPETNEPAIIPVETVTLKDIKDGTILWPKQE